MLDIDGIVTALQTKNVAFSSVRCGQLNVNGAAEFAQSIYCESTVTSEGKIRSNTGFDPGTGTTYTGKQCAFTAKYNFVVDNGNGTTSTVYGRLVSSSENSSIFYLGASAI
jgi:spore coat protein U-like protein